MVDQFILKIRGDEVTNASRYPGQHVHNLHARPTARGKADGLLERRVIRGNGIDVDEDAGEGDHQSEIFKLAPIVQNRSADLLPLRSSGRLCYSIKQARCLTAARWII